jgi:hypothetical protein
MLIDAGGGELLKIVGQSVDLVQRDFPSLRTLIG